MAGNVMDPMPSFLAAVLLLSASFSVTLEPPFGRAEARATDVGPEGLVLEVEVEIDTQALVVLVRGVGPVDELPPVALAELGPGRWGGVVEMPVVVDILLGFEIIRPDGGSAIVSELHRLSELGVDPAVFDVVDTTTTVAASATGDDGGGGAPVTDTGPSTAPIWLAVAAGTAALALLLVWWRGDRNNENAASAQDAAEPSDAG